MIFISFYTDSSFDTRNHEKQQRNNEILTPWDTDPSAFLHLNKLQKVKKHKVAKAKIRNEL